MLAELIKVNCDGMMVLGAVYVMFFLELYEVVAKNVVLAGYVRYLSDSLM